MKCNVDILLRPTHQKRNARDLWPDCLCIVNADILRLSAQRHRWEGGLSRRSTLSHTGSALSGLTAVSSVADGHGGVEK